MSTSELIPIPETQQPSLFEGISDSELSDLEEELKDVKESENIRQAYAMDIAPNECDPDDLPIDTGDVWDWQVSMRMDYEDYENNCPYCLQGKYWGLMCPECRRWYIPLGFRLYNEVKRKRLKRYAILKLKNKKKNTKSECYTGSGPDAVTISK